MAIPRLGEPLLLTTDASNISISFNLSQMIDGRERVIEYEARGLRKAELNYSTSEKSEKELLAVVAGVEHDHDYLNGQKFIIRTDHMSLKYLSTMRHPTGRLARWNLILGRYNFEIQHKKNRENVVADALSRIELPHSGTGPKEELGQLLLNIEPDVFESETVSRRKRRYRLTEISLVDDILAPSISAVDSTVG